MVQKGDQENAKDLVNADEPQNLNSESIDSSLRYPGLYLDPDGDKEMALNKSYDFLRPNTSLDTDDLFTFSDNLSQASNCSSNSSTTGSLARNVSLADVELDLAQEEGKPDLMIKVKLKKLKFKNGNCIRLNPAVSGAKEIGLDFEDITNTSYSLRIRPLHNAVKEILQLDLIDKDCLEISCLKSLPVNWPSVLEDRGLLADYVMNKFVPYPGGSLRTPENDEQPEIYPGPVFDDRLGCAINQPYGMTAPDLPEAKQAYLMGTKRRDLPARYRRLRSDQYRDLEQETARCNFRFPENNWNLIPYNSNANTSQAQIGYTGLDNLGNTCFMNTVLQCLSNTEELRDFFLMTNFNLTINKTNPFGSNGRVATGFYGTVTQLWNGKHSSYSPQAFKDYISSKMNKFEGNAQEDSVEFMEIFLDLLHEDLNRVDRTAKIVPDPLPKAEDQMTDSELAEAMWRRHLQYNDSLIVDYFHGQLKSHLTCSVCAKSSVTFDPFLFLSVPLPKPQITLPIFFFSLDYEKKPLKISLTCNQDVKCSALLRQISEKFEVKELRLIVCKGDQEKIINDLSEPVFNYGDCDLLIFQVKSEEDCSEKVFNILIRQFRICTTKSYLERETCESEYWSLNDWVPGKLLKEPRNSYPLGRSFFVSLSKSELNYQNLSTAMKLRARHSVDMSVFSVEIEEDSRTEDRLPGKAVCVGDLTNEEESNADSSRESNRDSLEEINDAQIEIKVKPFMVGKKQVRSRVTKVESDYDQISFNILDIQGIATTTQINESTDFEALAERLPDCLIMQWRDDPESNYRVRVNSKDLDHSANYHELLNQINEKTVTRLEDCLQMFTDKEELSLEDSWHCPKCAKPQKASKQLTIWRLPKILIMQLKRFSYKQFSRDKIDNYIDFPLRNLDLANFVSEQNKQNLAGRTTYDLYAVINHYGSIYSGHYTATAKTVFKGNEFGWRVFDDYNVDDIDEGSIVTNNAYILFYRLNEQPTAGMETAIPAMRPETAESSDCRAPM